MLHRLQNSLFMPSTQIIVSCSVI